MVRPQRTVSVQDVSKHYDDLNTIYRGVWGNHLHHGLWHKKEESKEQAVRNLVLKVVDTANIQQNAKICDVGCGYGETSRILAKEFKSNVLGFTISDSQIKYALSIPDQSQGRIKYLNCDWLKNDLEANCFDHVISIESSEHMSSLEEFFQESYRTLKPGGSLVVCAWLSKENPSALEINYLLEPICSEGRLMGLGTSTEYCDMFRFNGFEQITFEDLSVSVKKTWSLSILGLLPYFMNNPKDVRLLSTKTNPNANFLASLFRIRLAYETGTMRYGIFKGVKPFNSYP